MRPMQTAWRPVRLTVGDVMTEPVMTACETATFHELATLMTRHSVSALPIVDLAGRVVGIVSETDLLPKQALPPTPGLWPGRPRSGERVKAAGITAGDVMSSPVVSARPGERLAVAVRRMLDHDVDQLPVRESDGQLVGMLSRQDALRVFQRADEEIRLDIVDGVLRHWMHVDAPSVDVSVAGGVVLLRGGLEHRTDVTTLGHLVAGLDGVVAVHNELRWTLDDAALPSALDLAVR